MLPMRTMSEERPPTTTRAVRGRSQLRRTCSTCGGTPAAASLVPSRSVETLSKAPDTSEQHTATRRPFALA
eukprot:1406110-Alexandrium_andersonii.AAC.1